EGLADRTRNDSRRDFLVHGPASNGTSERFRNSACDQLVPLAVRMKSIEGEAVMMREQIGRLDEREIRIGGEAREEARVPAIDEHRQLIAERRLHERVVQRDEENARTRI